MRTRILNKRNLLLGLVLLLTLPMVTPAQRVQEAGSRLQHQRISSSGYAHTLEIRGGELWAWGRNDFGQLGTGDTNDRTSPVRIGTGTDWVSVETGFYHSLALKADGSLWAWGNGSEGALSNGSTANSRVPVQVGSSTDWIAIAAGVQYSLALRADGTLWAWGDNSYNQLGNGTTVDQYSPVQIGTDKWRSIGAMAFHSMALKADGTLWGWGFNGNGDLGTGDFNNKAIPTQIGTGKDWVKISVGYGRTAAIKADGTLWVWGTGRGNRPVQLGATTDQWVDVATGDTHWMAVQADGSLWGIGNNGSGQLGDGTTTQRTNLVRIGLENNWVGVDVGERISFALKADGTTWATGANNLGQLGDGTTADKSNFTLISTQPQYWQTVSANEFGHTMALRSDGSLWAWGYNATGGVGNGTKINQMTPQRIGQDKDWKQVASATYHSIALKADGTLWTWGNNESGQLGTNSGSEELTPKQVGTDKWISIAAKSHGSFAIKADGTLWAAGSMIGDGTSNVVRTFKKIGDSNQWRSIIASRGRTLALQADGSLWVWGKADYPGVELGTGKNEELSPARIGTDTDWVAIKTIYNHNCAIKSDGTLWAWGLNTEGQLGTSGSITVPTKVGTATNWMSIAGGATHTMGIQANGTLWAWGRNDRGQYGVATISSSTTPVQLAGQSKVVQVAGGTYTSFTLTADRKKICVTGESNSGGLGLGSTITVTTFTCITPTPRIVTTAVAACPGTSVNLTTAFTDANDVAGTVTYWTDAAATQPLASPAAVTVAGTYYIKKTAAEGGNADTKPVAVSFSQAPAAPTANGTWAGSIPYNESKTYAVNAVTGATGYVWAVPTGFQIVGDATGASVTIKATTGTASGAVTVKAKNSCTQESAALSFNVAAAKAAQTITFPAIANKRQGDVFTLPATTDKGLSISYVSSNSAVATVQGNTVTVLAITGSTQITASQAGDQNHEAAASVTQPLQVTVTSSAEEIASAKASLYPNPTADGKITLTGLPQQKSYQVRVIDGKGREVKQFTSRPATTAGTIGLDLSKLAAGQYTLLVQAGELTLTKRVVKQ